MALDTKDRTGAVGLAAFILCLSLYDYFVIKNGKESVSGAVWKMQMNPIGGPLLVGGWAAVTWHLFIDNPLKKIQQVVDIAAEEM